MPVDAKVQAILDAAKARGGKPLELQTPEEARAERAEMMARFVPMPEYAGVQVEERVIVTGGREIAVRMYRPAEAQGTMPVVVYFHGGGFVMGTLETHDQIKDGSPTILNENLIMNCAKILIHVRDFVFQIAEVYAFRGENDHAFEWLDRTFAEHDPGLTTLKSDPLLKNLRHDPRYAALLKKMRL
jgi:hypothetical protein